MFFLVRTISASPVQGETAQDASPALDNEYQGDELSLGGDDQCMVPLAISGSLLIKAGSGGAGRIRALDTTLMLGGKTVRRARVRVGDELVLAGYTLTVLAPPAGFDFALQVSVSGAAQPVYIAETSLAASAWSKRRVSWIGVALVLLFALALPLQGIINDSLWSTGPLASAHAAAGLGQECESCHAQPFVMVRDSACLDCHRATHEHVDLASFEHTEFTSDHFVGERCAGCHREHNEPPSLVRQDPGLCVNCHGDSGAWREDVLTVNGFSHTEHPGFRLALLVPEGPGAALGWKQLRVRQAPGELEEQSNLKFPHRDHLDPAKVREAATDAPLVCADCHRLQDDGEHFTPVTMDHDCRRCHALNFDVFEPDLELPHGDQRAALVAMEAHFIREFTDPVLRRQRAQEKPRRIPGKRVAAATCEGTGLQCGREEAIKEAQYQFAETGCVSCHQVADRGPVNDAVDRWYVEPVRVTGDWYPFARFDHRSHFNLDIADSGSEAGALCAGCHKAQESNAATDILIPAQDNCLQCHNETRGANTVACVACHAFHSPTGSSALQARSGAGRR